MPNMNIAKQITEDGARAIMNMNSILKHGNTRHVKPHQIAFNQLSKP